MSTTNKWAGLTQAQLGLPFTVEHDEIDTLMSALGETISELN